MVVDLEILSMKGKLSRFAPVSHFPQVTLLIGFMIKITDNCFNFTRGFY